MELQLNFHSRELLELEMELEIYVELQTSWFHEWSGVEFQFHSQLPRRVPRAFPHHST